MSCHRCSKTHSTVQAFLLTCCACNRKWHHRCHVPPVTDSELILRIRAHNVGDSANGIQGWKCKRCTRSGPVGSTPAPNLPSLHSSSIRAPSSATDDDVIVVDSSNSDVTRSRSKVGFSQSRRAPTEAQPQLPPVSTKGVDSKLQSLNPPPPPPPPLVVRRKEIHPPPLVVREREAHPPSSNNDHSSPIHPLPTASTNQQSAQPMTIDNDDVIIIDPSQLPNKETRRNQFRRNAKDRERNKRMEHQQRQQELLKVKTEAKEASETTVLNLDTISSQEPLPQPQIPDVTTSMGHLSVEGETLLVGPLAAENPEGVSQREANLAPRWFRDDANDMWARALRSKASIPSSSIARRKIQGRRLNEARPPIFNFDVVRWENQMRRI